MRGIGLPDLAKPRWQSIRPDEAAPGQLADWLALGQVIARVGLLLSTKILFVIWLIRGH